MKVGVLFSGGKDSVYAMYKARKKNKVVCLISVISENKESYMFHTPNIELVDIQAKVLGLPLIKVNTKGEKEKELKDLEKAISIAKKKYKIQGIVTGAVASNYQASRVQGICNQLKLLCLNPLWQMNQEKYMREVIKSGFKFIVTHISAEGLDKDWLGKVITNKDIDKLVELNKKNKINIAFDGGEAETLVIDGPIFEYKIVIKKAEKKMENESTGTYEINEMKLI